MVINWESIGDTFRRKISNVTNKPCNINHPLFLKKKKPKKNTKAGAAEPPDPVPGSCSPSKAAAEGSRAHSQAPPGKAPAARPPRYGPFALRRGGEAVAAAGRDEGAGQGRTRAAAIQRSGAEPGSSPAAAGRPPAATPLRLPLRHRLPPPPAPPGLPAPGGGRRCPATSSPAPRRLLPPDGDAGAGTVTGRAAGRVAGLGWLPSGGAWPPGAGHPAPARRTPQGVPQLRAAGAVVWLWKLSWTS